MKIDFGTVKEALSQPKSRNFRISFKDGAYSAGDSVSFYSTIGPDEHLTYDISNNKVLVNMGYNGALKYVTIFREDYLCDTGHFWPGVWVNRDFTKYGPYSFTLRLGKEIIRLAECKWNYTTSLLGNIFPITEFTGDSLKATVLCYTPISGNGEIRPRGVIYGLFLENISDCRLGGSVLLPKMFSPDNVSANVTEAGLKCYSDLNMNLLDHYDKKTEVDFNLAPGQTIWVPALLYSYGDPTLKEIDSEGSLYWLNSTWSYFKSMTGDLIMQEDDFTAEFFERSIYQCYESIGMDGKGNINGSNWGSYPPTRQIWMKDMYYSYLPFFMLEPEFFKKGIIWFTEYSLRPKGVEFEGGVNHSISNALTPALMGGLYYTCTGDKDFFLQNPKVIERIKYILETLLETRKDKGVWLFTSKFISDGLSASDYHTGTNLCVWYSFKSFARILNEVYLEEKLSKYYNMIADRIREAIETHNIINGPFGKQYIEGTNSDGSVPWMGHEGEESDTTLMPLYGYLDYDNPVYKNYTQFAVSEHNAAYSPVTKGIKWGETLDPLPVPATFPGYITGFVNSVDAGTMAGENGYFTEIRKLTDVDGSLWWWPYRGQSGQLQYGKPMRMNITGKCGWAAGLFAGMFINQILGLRYDAPTTTLSFRPFSPSSSFTWNNLRLGSGNFSVSYLKQGNEIEVEITNHNDYNVILQLEIILQGSNDEKVYMNEKEYNKEIGKGQFLGMNTVKISEALLVQEKKKIRVIEL